MDRREFMSWVGLGMIVSSLPAAIAACTTQPEEKSVANQSPGSDGFTPVGTVAQLDQAGFIADKNFAAGAVIVVRDPQNPQALIALDSVCPHKDCNVDWKADKKAFVCPCHDSIFDTTGAVKTGPATKSLKVFSAKIDGGRVLVKA